MAYSASRRQWPPGGRELDIKGKQLTGVAQKLAIHGLNAAALAKIEADRRRATPAGQRLLRTLNRWLRDDFSSGDRGWFQEVESRRRGLLASTVEITKKDYGAGTRNTCLTETETSAGFTTRGTVADVCRSTSKSARWARLLYALVDEYRPANALELGTSLAISAMYQGGALRKHGGHMMTVEGAPEVATIARTEVESLGLRDVVGVVSGRFSDVLPQLLPSIGPLEYVFIDGHHDERATQDYHAMIKPYLSRGAVLVYDDIRWSSGMKRAWQAISADSDLCATVDLGAVGVAIREDEPKRAYRYHLRGSD